MKGAVLSQFRILAYRGCNHKQHDGRKNMARISMAASAAVVGCLALASTGAHAQGVLSIQKLSAPLANELVGESVAQCAQKNYAVTAVVVDLDGVRQAMLRGNGAPIHTLDNAFYKAYSSASLTLARKEDSTKTVNERMAKAAATTVPATPLPNVTYAVGGVAIMAGGNIIGGIPGSSGTAGHVHYELATRAPP